MDLSFFRGLYEKGLFLICDGFDSWEDSIFAAIRPLEEQGFVTHEYAERTIAHVEKYGPYIFMAPHICMPHCNAYEYVKASGVAFMKSNRPVIINEEEPEMGAELFFAVAARSAGEHIGEIQRLGELLMDDAVIDALVAAKTENDFRILFGIEDKN